MIIVRSPVRISIGGGGTDLPSYYREHEGFVIAAAIDKYVYITLHQTFVSDLLIKYSRMERVSHVDEIQHPIIREALKLLEMDGSGLELVSMADIPAGTGLGSSGSFTTALLKSLHLHKNDLIHPQELAAEACHIEIDRLGEPIGKQDQYIAAYGGVTCFRFQLGGQVEAWPLNLPEETLYDLEENLLLFFTGYSRLASSILQEQDEKSRAGDHDMVENLHFIKEIALRIQKALEAGDARQFGLLMNEHWERKKQRSKNMSNGKMDEWYRLALENGAVGGKLIGAGGGGFLLFYVEDKNLLRRAFKNTGLREVRFRFDFEGTRALVQ
ncbi:galactokinase [Nitrospinota bacterium]